MTIPRDDPSPFTTLLKAQHLMGIQHSDTHPAEIVPQRNGAGINGTAIAA